MKVKSKIFYCYVVFVTTYLLLTLLPAPDPATLTKYHLGSTRLRLLDLTLVIPIILIWLAAFYGYVKMQTYTRLIGTQKDGQAIAWLTKGLLVLAVGLPLNSIVSSTLTLIARSEPGFTNAAAILNNYLGMLYPLLAFVCISFGARALNDLNRSKLSLLSLYSVTLLTIVLGVGFCDLIARAHANIRTTYHLTYSLVMFTFAIPCMFMWFLGFMAGTELFQYSRKVAGIVYRHAWSRLATGLVVIIVTDIAIQYLSTLSAWTTALSLGGILLLLYVLLLALAIGYIVVALGAKKLTKIEEA
jgi:hypothetical protein